MRADRPTQSVCVCRYVEIAAALGSNSTLRAEVSARIVTNTVQIFDDQTAIRAFEQEMVGAVASAAAAAAARP